LRPTLSSRIQTTQLDRDLLADFRRLGDDRHDAAGREVLDLDQLLVAGCIGQLSDAEHRRQSLIGAALGRPWNCGGQGDCGRFEGSVAATDGLATKFPPDQLCEHAET